MLEFVLMNESYSKEALELYNWYVLNSTATFSIQPIDQREMNGILFSGHERFPSYAIIEDGLFVGYILLARYKAREAYDKTAEVTIYLTKSSTGRGIGSKAMSFIESIAKEFDFRALLSVICAENESSIELFKKFDYFECAHFRKVGEKFGRILDVVVYEKLINDSNLFELI